MKRTRWHWTAAVLAVSAGVVAALAAYQSPFPPNLEHQSSSTCNTEPCPRACRLCCLHFHDNQSPEYAYCKDVLCASVGGMCNEGEGEG